MLFKSPMEVKNLDPIRHRLPFLRNFDEAEAFAEQQHDPFYLAAFLIQCWLGELVTRAAAQYAEIKTPKDRLFQTGESWRALVQFFNLKPENPCDYLLSSFYRFCVLDDSPGNSLRRSLTPFVIERRLTGEHSALNEPRDARSFLNRNRNRNPNLPFFAGSSTLDSSQRERNPLPSPGGEGEPSPTSSLPLNQQTLLRWCDWLDAEIHLRTHRRWHESPACFHPDPETRHLAALGNAQRHLAKLDDRAKACWLADFTTAADHYRNSPKWPALGKAMADNSDRLWQYPNVDTLVIALWPIVKVYNWTFRDLITVIRPGLSRRGEPKSGPSTSNDQPSSPPYPCAREQDFAAYCLNHLGLRKSARGVSSKDGLPTGIEIARQWCPALGPRH